MTIVEDSDILSDCKHPIDFRSLFLSHDVLNLIVDGTNRYGSAKEQNWVLKDDREMKRFSSFVFR